MGPSLNDAGQPLQNARKTHQNPFLPATRMTRGAIPMEKHTRKVGKTPVAGVSMLTCDDVHAMNVKF